MDLHQDLGEYIFGRNSTVTHLFASDRRTKDDVI